jgi:hypothetical protein
MPRKKIEETEIPAIEETQETTATEELLVEGVMFAALPELEDSDDDAPRDDSEAVVPELPSDDAEVISPDDPPMEEPTPEIPVEEPLFAAPLPDILIEEHDEPPPPKKPARARKKKPPGETAADEPTPAPRPAPKPRAAPKKVKAPPVLTIEARDEVETQEEREDTIWHEIHNAYRTRKMLTGTLGGVEQTENGKTIAIVYFKEFRIAIPMSEMLVKQSKAVVDDYDDLLRRQSKILNNMLGSEIDFVVKGIDSKTRSVVASRRDAMLKKRQTFYLRPDASGGARIREGAIVQARVIAVSDKLIRVEVFGVECIIFARDLTWEPLHIPP